MAGGGLRAGARRADLGGELYPFYGAIRLDPPESLPRALEGDAVVATEDVLDRLGLRPGGTLRLGAAEFRVAAILRNEPDRLASLPLVQPRVMLSPESLERSRLQRSGSRSVMRLLVKAPANGDANAIRRRFAKIFPRASLIDYRDADLGAIHAVEGAAALIGMTGWMAIGFGALTAGLVAYLGVRQRLDSIAVMKCLGARSSSIVAIYLAESGGIALCGALAGLPLGVGLQWIFLAVAESRLPIPLSPRFSWEMAAGSVAAGVAASLAAAAAPILSIRRIPPLLVLRRSHEPATKSGAGVRAALALVVAASLAAAWHQRSVGGAFAGAVAAGILVLGGIAGRMLRAASAWAPAALPFWARAGLANLNRPGGRPAAMITGLSVGVMWLTACYAGQKPVDRAIAESLPFADAELYLLSVGGSQIDRLTAYLRAAPGVMQPAEVIENAVLTLAAVNGVPREDWGAHQKSPVPRRLVVRCRPDLTGAWLSSRNAQALGVGRGARLEFRSRGSSLAVRVDRVVAVDAFRGYRLGFQMPCGSAAGLNPFYEVAVRTEAGRDEEVRLALARDFPELTAVRSSEVLSVWQEIGHRAIVLLALIGGLVMACGAAMLALLVAVDKRQRMREIAISKAMGATSGALARIYAVEFGAAGALAGLAGGALGCLSGSLMVSVIFERWVPAGDLASVPLAGALTALVAAGAGGAVSRRLLRLKPLEILRAE